MMPSDLGEGDGNMGAIIGVGNHCDSATIPIYVKNAANVGSVHVEITFDPSVAKYVSVSNGDMDSMFTNDERASSGIFIVGAYQTMNAGLNGDFILANMVFNKSTAESKNCILKVKVNTFKDSTPAGSSLLYSISYGSYRTNCSDPIPPVPDPDPDPCDGVVCSPDCFGLDYYKTVCDDGICIKGALIESNSYVCGYLPPEPDPPDPDPDPTPDEKMNVVFIAIIIAFIYIVMS